MIPTLIGITIVCFTLIQMVPGGPVEQYLSRISGAESLQGANANNTISQEEVAIVRAYYGFDRPAIERYFSWLWNLLHLDFGDSYFYEEPVWDVVTERMPISLFFGLTSFLLSYAVCIPLGIFKAVKKDTWADTLSSILIYIGYVMPAYALGVLLIILFCGGSYLDWFPLGGVMSGSFEELGFLWGILDFMHHMILPMICFMAGEFAVLTILMKNSLLEEIHKEYIRTALLKGSSRLRAVMVHGLRNALIPIATRLSEIFTLVFAGALLIERVFDIDGMGLLFYNSIVRRDYNVVLGLIVMTSFLSLVGRLFSDLLYALVDPRIRFK
jgi:microcin C transport system permease protein